MSEEDIEHVRATLFDIGLGFRGMDDDQVILDFITNLQQQREHPTHSISENTLLEDYPVLAISNYAEFISNADLDALKPYYEGLRREINDYLGAEINVMHILTAGVHHDNSTRSLERRRNVLLYGPRALEKTMQELLGAGINNFHHVHICDKRMECQLPKSLSTVNLEGFKNIANIDHFTTFDCDAPNTAQDLYAFMTEKKINFLFLLGGETHWLNKQLTRVEFKDVLHKYKNEGHKLVLGGSGAGIINIGTSSFITAYKAYSEPGMPHDDLRDLCDDRGRAMEDACLGFVKPPEICNIHGVDFRIKYDTLGFSPFVYFPHYRDEGEASSDNKYIDGSMVRQRKFLDCIRLTDKMMAFTRNGKTSFIFSQPRVHNLVADPLFAAITAKPKAYGMARRIFMTWYHLELAENRDHALVAGDMLAYLYSCASVPESKRLDIRTTVGGAKSSSIFGMIIGLAIVFVCSINSWH